MSLGIWHAAGCVEGRGGIGDGVSVAERSIARQLGWHAGVGWGCMDAGVLPLRDALLLVVVKCCDGRPGDLVSRGTH